MKSLSLLIQFPDELKFTEIDTGYGRLFKE